MEKQNIYTIKNKNIIVEIEKHPFQISSIKYKGEELIYQKDQKWRWSFPIMAPMCTLAFGKRSNSKNEYIANDNIYDLVFHGFSRHNSWKLEEIKDDYIVVSQSHKADKQYPWSFNIFYRIEIIKDNVNVSLKIVNLSDETMYYSTGTHPGYLLKGNDIVRFNGKNEYKFTRSDDYLKSDAPEFLNINSKKINVKKDLDFTKYDTLVGEKSNDVSFSLINDHYELNFETNFKMLWLWQEDNDANYICLETSDITPPNIEGVHDIKERRNILTLDKGKSTTKEYNMQIIENNSKF